MSLKLGLANPHITKNKITLCICGIRIASFTSLIFLLTSLQKPGDVAELGEPLYSISLFIMKPAQVMNIEIAR